MAQLAQARSQLEIHRSGEKLDYAIRNGRVVFDQSVLRAHRRLRRNVIHYVLGTNLLFVLTSPIIYSLIIPAVILDFFCCVYQFVYFPIYRIPKVSRQLYFRMDRQKLGYLNAVEKLNCSFCAYFNGVIAFAREIASRTEQYWCPIRHAMDVRGSHNRYSRFFRYGDAESYSKELKKLRRQLIVQSPKDEGASCV
jgi:hypothetical protein